MHVRPALSDDAAKICDVLRRSITELCTVDHEDATIFCCLGSPTRPRKM